jgi:hypothetical protein
MRTVDKILAAIPLLTVSSFAPTAAARAQAMTLGEAANYALLGLNNGMVRVDTGSVVVGDFGYSAGVVSTTNKLVGSDYFGQWTGTAYVHSRVGSFDADVNYEPTGGIVTNPLQDARLDRANADAVAFSQWVASLPATENLGTLYDKSVTLGSVDGLRTVHVVEIASLTMSDNVLELVGDEVDVFVLNVRGNFLFMHSEVRLTGGITANHVLFNLPPGGDYTKNVGINKSGTQFRGTLLAPDLGDRKIEYHDTGSFLGAIIAPHIDVHSDFSLVHAPFTATVCLCTGPGATVEDDLPSCNTSLDPVLGATRPVISTVAETHVTSHFPFSLLFLVGSLGTPTPFVFPGTTCTIHVNLPQALVVSAAFTDGAGGWSAGITIPAVCEYVGLPIALQAAILDAQVPGPIPARLSNGVLMTVGL